MIKECKQCTLALPENCRADKEFCNDICRNTWHRSHKEKIGKIKVKGMLLLLNKIMWKVDETALQEIIGYANKIPNLPGRFQNGKEGTFFTYIKKSAK